jgi:membrane-associated phospholipid phosphatase
MIPSVFWQFISYFGDIAYWIGFSISFLIIYPLLSKSDKEKVIWVFYALLPSVMASYLLATILKSLFHVPRPCVLLEACPSTYSFPSGHTAVAFAFATVAISNMGKKKWYLFVIPLAILVGLSRIFLGLHTVIDVVGGGTLGILCGYTLQSLYRKFLRKNHVIVLP